MAPHDGSDDPTGLLYGFHTVLEALQSRTRAIQRLWVIRSDGRYFPLTRLAKERGIPFSIESRERLDQLANDRHHQGVVANITSKEYLEGEELLDSLLESPTPALLVVLDQIQDPHNLGAVIRSVDAAGAHGIVIPKHRAVGITGGVAKASAGALEYVQIARVANTGKFIEECQKQDIVTVALDPEGHSSYSEIDMTGPIALVFGSEGEGIRPIVRRKCDQQVHIPMKGRINSLNVSVSVAVTLFEAVRQRMGTKG
ncbi:MAG TPA: 23S rRNA (guanosine(2251)-2'-O)-methyltransferase RlmB [Nitrospirales bacterium]|nr:23S rRNA (guanosine(2251)-2'-O)-methyltransferase RlmB [Nitrospirales bacterium]